MTPKETLIAYLKVKTEEGDWHAVSDAANDLRVLEAREAHSQTIYLEAGMELTEEHVNGKRMLRVKKK